MNIDFTVSDFSRGTFYEVKEWDICDYYIAITSLETWF